MNTLRLILKKEDGTEVVKNYSGASSWNELTELDLLVLAKCSNMGLSMVNCKFIMAIQLFKINVKDFNSLSHPNKYHILKLVDFLFGKCELNKWLVKSIRVGFKKYYGPQDKLADLTAIEMAWIEKKYSEYIVNPKFDKIDEIIALLYRPKRFLSNKRADFNEDLATETLARVKLLPMPIKHAIFLNYKGCRNFIIDAHPIIFSSEGKKEAGTSTKSIWEPIYRKLARTNVFGTYDQVKKQNYYTVLAELSDMIKDQQAVEEKLNKKSR